MHALRDDIKRKWFGEGLHIAQVVEVGLARELLAALARDNRSPDDVSRILCTFLNLAEKWAIFVREDSSVPRILRDVRTRLSAEPKFVLGLFSMGSRAKGNLTDVVKALRKEGGYDFGVTEAGPETTVLISRRSDD